MLTCNYTYMQTPAPAPRCYQGRQLERIAFPLGGIGAGMVCLTGNGGLAHWSLRNRPEFFTDLPAVATLRVGNGQARVLQGPVPRWRAHQPWGGGFKGSGGGQEDRDFGFRRCRAATFTGRFPFATVALDQPDWPVTVALKAWSPFIPGDADASSLPVAALAYTITNPGATAQTVEFAWHANNLLHPQHQDCLVEARPDGFVLRHVPPDAPWHHVALRYACSHAVTVDADWPDAPGQTWMLNRSFPTRWLDRLPRADREHPERKSPGGSCYTTLVIPPGGSETIIMRLAWYAPDSDQRAGHPAEPDAAARFKAGTHRPWYAGHFASLDAVAEHWLAQYGALEHRTRAFSDALWASTLPEPMLDALAANLAILRTPTVLRQTDGRLWAWEGCHDDFGSCHGSCTHVWHYAQAIAHLFPALERTLRETELRLNQDARGHQNFRATLPLGTPDHHNHAALDGQLGGLMKLHREWRISGDDAWLRGLWPAAVQSYIFCTTTWDPDGDGIIDQAHHNTFDIEFQGRDPMAQTFYAGACAAMAAMAEGLGADPAPYRAREQLAAAGLESQFNGEWFIQPGVDPATFTPVAGHNDARLLASRQFAALIRSEGPAYQFRSGVLSECTTGLWLADQCGLAPQQPAAAVRQHLASVVTHNFRADLSEHDNPQRPAYAFGDDGGLLVCTWPAGGEPTIPFPYSDEVWTGSEYQLACHLLRTGQHAAAERIVATARARHDGEKRNPFNEQECGHWYARALASYGLLQAWGGVRYDKRARTLHLAPARAAAAAPVTAGDYTVFLAWDGGFGTAGLRAGKPFCTPVEGTIDIARFAIQSPG